MSWNDDALLVTMVCDVICDLCCDINVSWMGFWWMFSRWRGKPKGKVDSSENHLNIKPHNCLWGQTTNNETVSKDLSARRSVPTRQKWNPMTDRCLQQHLLERSRKKYSGPRWIRISFFFAGISFELAEKNRSLWVVGERKCCWIFVRIVRSFETNWFEKPETFDMSEKGCEWPVFSVRTHTQIQVNKCCDKFHGAIKMPEV